MTDSGSDPTDPRRPTPESSTDPSAGAPTGWERPTSDPTSSFGADSADANPSGSTPPESPSGFPSGAGSSAAEWPTYPASGTEPTRPLPPDASYSGLADPPYSPQSYPQPYPPSSAETPPYQPPYQPYDPQSMPGYGSSSGYPPAEAPQGYPGAGPAGYGNNPYEVNQYQGGYPGYAGYGPPPNHPQAVTAFVLGLVGLVVCTPVGIGGLVIGGRVRKEIDAAPGQYSGRGLATAGWVLGIISVVLLALGAVFVIIGISAGAFSN